jgi:2,3-bisphosphoglycerate-dependent phosphoglycerate mutase
MLLYCVRHGESTHNAAGRIQGQADIPLSDFGRRQSQAVAEALAAQGIDVIYSSPLCRALETAEIVARHLKLGVRTDARLMEINAGIFQNRLRAEIGERYPAEFARWVAGDPDFVIPGGESRNDLIRRGCDAVRDIALAGHPRAVIVSHGRILALTVKALAGFSAGEASPSLENGAITTLMFHPDARFELVAFNQVDHLQQVGLAGRGDL